MGEKMRVSSKLSVAPGPRCWRAIPATVPQGGASPLSPATTPPPTPRSPHWPDSSDSNPSISDVTTPVADFHSFGGPLTGHSLISQPIIGNTPAEMDIAELA